LGLIFDEWYYINAARNIIGRPMIFGSISAKLASITNGSTSIVTTRYYSVPKEYASAPRFTDPNREHPPLAKLIVAFSALLLGENAIAYRLPSAIFGTALLAFMYFAARRISNEQVAFYAATLLSFDTLTIIQSRVFMLDIFMVSFMVLAFYLFLRGNPVAAGVAVGLSALCKEFGAVGLLVIITFGILEPVSKERFNIRRTAELVAKVLFGFILPVSLLSASMAIWWNVGPLEQIRQVISLPQLRVERYFLDGSYIAFDSSYHQFGMICPPWLWMLNANPIEYFKNGAGANVRVDYVAMMNPMIIYLMVPAVVYSVWHYSKTRDRVDLFALVWWAFSYLTWYPLAFAGRIMFIFYMAPAMGAISLMIANLMCHPSINSYARCSYLLAVIVAALLQFPVKSFP
jgi:predicted membrane-bound dolichyl-phosphate-mannose-protein mannosyltransferase